MNTLFNKRRGNIETCINFSNYAKDNIDSGSMFENRRKISKQEMATLILFADGVIRNYNEEAVRLLDYLPNELTGQHISKVLPQLAEIQLVQMQRVNPYLRYLSRKGHQFKIVNKEGTHFSGELMFRDMEKLGLYHLRVIIYPTWQIGTASQQAQAS